MFFQVSSPTVLLLLVSSSSFWGVTMGLGGRQAASTAARTLQQETAAELPPATFEVVTDCWFDIPDGNSADCGYLIVPANRRRWTEEGDTATVKVAVARLLHPSSGGENSHPDPLVYLGGGPGEAIISVLSIPGAYEGFAGLGVASNRDVILIDQRGAGFSEPALNCPVGAAYADVFALPSSSENAGELFSAAMSLCGQKLSENSNIHLEDFITSENAADIESLRIALGYEEWNLWGVSYGSRLALEIMRKYPNGIRTSILDSVMKPTLELGDNIETAHRSFSLLFDSCAADPECNAAFPDLKEVFETVINDLDANPPTIQPIHPETGKPTDILLTGAFFETIFFRFLYDAGAIPYLPGAIYAAANDGDYSLIEGGIPALFNLDKIFSVGMFLSMRCNGDNVALPSIEEYDAIKASNAEYDYLSGLVNLYLPFRPLAVVCPEWDAGTADPITWQPVVNDDIPTMLMTGEFDPALNPEAGEEVASTLANSYLYEFPGMGHGNVGSHPCPTQMLFQFLDNPTQEPDSSCMSEMGVHFEVAQPAATDGQSKDDEDTATNGSGSSGGSVLVASTTTTIKYLIGMVFLVFI